LFSNLPLPSKRAVEEDIPIFQIPEKRVKISIKDEKEGYEPFYYKKQIINATPNIKYESEVTPEEANEVVEINPSKLTNPDWKEHYFEYLKDERQMENLHEVVGQYIGAKGDKTKSKNHISSLIYQAMVLKSHTSHKIME